MGEDITRREALLIELVWLLSYGSENELGSSLKEVMDFLNSRMKRKGMKTAFELMDEEGHKFIAEVKAHLAEQSKNKISGN